VPKHLLEPHVLPPAAPPGAVEIGTVFGFDPLPSSRLDSCWETCLGFPVRVVEVCCCEIILLNQLIRSRFSGPLPAFNGRGLGVSTSANISMMSSQVEQSGFSSASLCLHISRKHWIMEKSIGYQLIGVDRLFEPCLRFWGL
jgi:hypothetical protein